MPTGKLSAVLAFSGVSFFRAALAGTTGPRRIFFEEELVDLFINTVGINPDIWHGAGWGYHEG